MKTMKISAYLLVLLCLVLQIIDLQAQICEGNLGENIFTDGDFGQETDNIVQVDPQIAPGYQYVTTPPPNDGQYTITNNTALWNNIWPGWQPIQDNGPGSTGYMLVVNASFTPGLFYEQEVSGLCENTLYEFSADVFNMIGAGANFILPNVSFLIDGQVFFVLHPCGKVSSILPFIYLCLHFIREH